LWHPRWKRFRTACGVRLHGGFRCGATGKERLVVEMPRRARIARIQLDSKMTLRARRDRATNGATLCSLVRMRDPAVGPRASYAATHARPRHEKSRQRGIHTCQKCNTDAPNSTTSRGPSAITVRVGQEHKDARVAQIKPPVLDRVHHALRAKQTVLAQVQLVPPGRHQCAYFAEWHFSIRPPLHPSVEERGRKE